MSYYNDFCMWPWNEQAARDMDNIGRMVRIVKKRGEELRKDPYTPITLEIKCFNKEEADFCANYLRSHHPDVPFYCTWINFK